MPIRSFARFTLTLPPLLYFAVASPGLARGFDETAYAAILERHTKAVEDTARTRVDYRALASSADWQRLLGSLGSARPSQLVTRQERLAFWINAYNILAIDVVARHYPVDSIRDIGSFFSPVWDRAIVEIEGRSYTLDQIEDDRLRSLGDPRIHFAIVCASTSCPALRREPYVAASIDAQLDRATRGFLADPSKGSRIDRQTGEIRLSKIFDWFEDDFARSGGVLAFVTPYLQPGDRTWMEQRAAAPEIEYFGYDWSLNDTAGH